MYFEQKRISFPSRKPALKYVAIWQQKTGQPGYMGGLDDGSVWLLNYYPCGSVFAFSTAAAGWHFEVDEYKNARHEGLIKRMVHSAWQL